MVYHSSFDRYYCPSATIFIPGVRFSFGFSGCRWYHHVFVGNSILLFVIAAAILLVQGVRKVPVQYAKRIVGNKQYGGARQYIPLKVNAANVMPIIFAQAIMFIPITLVGFSNAATASGIVRAFVDHTSFWYNFVFAILIIVFTYFYTAITINPNQMAEDMKRIMVLFRE